MSDAGKGRVFFVGAGPGAADLLTLRAARLIETADVVLHDDLVSAEILQLASPGAIVVNVGKRCGHPGTTQQRINQMMVEYAGRVASVVRLKQGDPSIYARLGEEIEALRQANIEFEIVPGVTAGIAAAAAAQISLTDRRVASSVAFVAAHLADGKRQDWSRFAAAKTTVVVYMPGPNYFELGTELLAAGFAPDLPCALISQASGGGEEVRCASLSELREVKGAGVPAVLIVGSVVAARRAASVNSEELVGTAVG
jgi:uroporphyrin-III C-methyltransferase